MLHAVTILVLSHTAPFSPWRFGDYLSQMLPLLCMGAAAVFYGHMFGWFGWGSLLLPALATLLLALVFALGSGWLLGLFVPCSHPAGGPTSAGCPGAMVRALFYRLFAYSGDDRSRICDACECDRGSDYPVNPLSNAEGIRQQQGYEIKSKKEGGVSDQRSYHHSGHRS